MSARLWLVSPGTSPSAPLLPRFEAALRAGDSPWYAVPDAGARRARTRQLAQRVPLLDPAIGTLEDLVARALRRREAPVSAPSDGRLAALLLRDAIAAAWPEVGPGPGLERAVAGAIRQLRADGWTAATFRQAADARASGHGGAARLAAIWCHYDALLPEADVATPLRGALATGLLREEAPALLLLEGGPLAGELHARLLRDLLQGVLARGGEVVAAVADVPTPGGDTGRAALVLEKLLGVAPERWTGAEERCAPVAALARTLFRAPGPAATGSSAPVPAPVAAPVPAPVRAPAGSTPAPNAGRGARPKPAGPQMSLFDPEPPPEAPERAATAPGEASAMPAASAVAPPPAPAPLAGEIVRLTGPDDATTADRIAREVRALLLAAPDAGALLARGVVVACPTEADRQAVESALREHALPVAQTPREPIAGHPGGRALLRLLDTLEHGADTPLEALLELLTADAWAFPPEAADALAAELQNRGAVTLQHALGVLAEMQGAAARRTRLRLQRLVELSGDFHASTGSAERSALLRSLLHAGGAGRGRGPQEAGARRLLDPRRGAWKRHGRQALADGHDATPPVRAAAGSARPLRRLEDLLTALEARARKLGVEPTPAGWLAALRELLEETRLQIGSAPPLGVRLEWAGALEPAAVVFVTGLVERRFPRGPRPEPFLADALRAGPEGAALLPPRQDADAERERFLLSCGAARERLYLCHPRSDADGRELLPSFFLEDVARALGLRAAALLPERRRRLDEVVPEPALCNGRAELRAALAAALHDPQLPEAARAATLRALDEELSRDESFRGILLTPFSDAPAALVEPAGAEFVRQKASGASASQLGMYAHCAFRHYAEKRLTPVAVEVPELDALRRGSALHELLRRFGAAGGWREPGTVLEQLRDAPLPEALPSLVSSGRSRLVWERARAQLLEFVARESARIAGAAFQPAYHELAFGPMPGERDPASLPEPVPVPLGDGVLQVTGSLDRVDVWEDRSGVRWGIAVDYKSGGLEREARAFKADEDLQLMLYLRLLEAFGIRPAGALYVSLLKERVVGVVHADFAAAAGALGRDVAIDARDVWERRIADAGERIAGHWKRMREPVIVARPKAWQCWPCELFGLCRTHPWRARAHV